MDEVATESGSDVVGFILFGANGRNKLNVSDAFESVLQISFLWTKNMVFVLSIRLPTPCANLPNSFAPALVQISLCLGSRSNC